jgi:hypothetical protein
MARFLQDEMCNLALGRMPKATGVHKFGARTGISTTSSTIWDDGLNDYPWSAFDNSQVLTVVAVNGADQASSITVVGLDDNYDEVTETITLAGANATGSVLFKRVYRAYISSGPENAGVITVRTGGATGTIVAQMNEGMAQTLMCIFTVPRNRTGLLLKGVCSASADKDMIIEFYGRFQDEQGNYGPFRIQHIANMYQNNYVYEFAVPLALPEKTDLDVRVVGYSNDSGSKVAAAFDMILYEVETDY